MFVMFEKLVYIFGIHSPKFALFDIPYRSQLLDTLISVCEVIFDRLLNFRRLGVQMNEECRSTY